MNKKALGKGLGAFIPDEFSILKDERFAELDLEDVKPNPFQPRMKFDDQTIDELAQSIRETGIVQPVIVTPEADHYKIIVGERRWRAAQKAGLRKIPVLIRNIPKEKQLEVSLIENIHREELNALEIAHAYQKLIDDLGYAQHELADKVGKDRSSVANYLRGARPGPPGPGGDGDAALRLPADHRSGAFGQEHRGSRQPAQEESAPDAAQPGRSRPLRPAGRDAQDPGDEGPRRGHSRQGRREDILFLVG
jgi:ParB/RepB/Spo0J family partition protein